MKRKIDGCASNFDFPLFSLFCLFGAREKNGMRKDQVTRESESESDWVRVKRYGER